MVDSIQKKIRVVNEVANSLELKNVSVTNDRFEHIKQKTDNIISRGSLSTYQNLIPSQMQLQFLANTKRKNAST